SASRLPRRLWPRRSPEYPCRCAGSPAAMCDRSRSRRRPGHGSWFTWRFAKPYSKQLPNRLKQILLIKGAFDEVGVGADFDAAGLGAFAVAGGDQDDRQLAEARGAAHRFSKRETVQARHVDVGDHEIGTLLLKRLPGDVPIRGSRYLVSRRFKDRFHQCARS